MPPTVPPPVTGRSDTLPFDRLSPSDLEELCLWLVAREGFERVEHLGKSGSERGRDVVAWKDGRQWAFQCERRARFSYAVAKAEIEKIRCEVAAHEQPDELVFVVSRSAG